MSEKKPALAADLRQALLSMPVEPNAPFVFKGKVVAYIRTPLMTDRTRMMDAAGLTKAINAAKSKAARGRQSAVEDIETPPVDAMMAAACITLAVDEVGNPLFTAGDLEAIRTSPASGAIGKLARACLDAINGDDEEGEGSGDSRVAASSTSSPTA